VLIGLITDFEWTVTEFFEKFPLTYTFVTHIGSKIFQLNFKYYLWIIQLHFMQKISLGIGSRVKHPQFGDGVVVQIKPEDYIITFMQNGMREIERTTDQLEIIDANDADNDLVSLADIEVLLVNVLRKYSDIQERVEMGNKWVGGSVILKPGDTSLKPKEIPVDIFFGKIIMLRDRLRVLEQHINSNKKLSEEDKIDLQQYITRCYGSLTTFNVLFKYATDQFVGEKGSRD
jgi:hypothetical protein